MGVVLRDREDGRLRDGECKRIVGRMWG